jgi:hypothetical protein
MSVNDNVTRFGVLLNSLILLSTTVDDGDEGGERQGCVARRSEAGIIRCDLNIHTVPVPDTCNSLELIQASSLDGSRLTANSSEMAVSSVTSLRTNHADVYIYVVCKPSVHNNLDS